MAIQLHTLLKRKPGTTHEEFLDHWFNRHGPLIVNGSSAKYVRRYEQHPVVWPTDPSKPEPEYDGITTQIYDSMADFYAVTREPDFPEVMEDVARFLDPTAMIVVLTEEPNLVIGDPR
jgi:uncharacterized protein (TIGR02118 family)